MKLAQLFEAQDGGLQAIVDALNKDRSIDEADLLKDGIEVATVKGDFVIFHLTSKGQLHAQVQGQKNDIDVGEIGSTAEDVLAFLKGINVAWYREHDKHFN